MNNEAMIESIELQTDELRCHFNKIVSNWKNDVFSSLGKSNTWCVNKIREELANLATYPPDSERYLKAIAGIDNNDLLPAIQIYKAIIESMDIDRREAMISDIVALGYLTLMIDTEKSIQHFKAAIDLDMHNFYAYLGLARVLFDRGKYKESAEAYIMVEKLNAGLDPLVTIEILTERGIWMCEQKAYQESIACFIEGLSIAEHHSLTNTSPAAVLHANLSSSYCLQSEQIKQKYNDYLDKAENSTTDKSVFEKASSKYVELLSKAKNEISAAAKIYHANDNFYNEANAFFTLARCYASNNEWEGALNAAQHAKAIFEKHHYSTEVEVAEKMVQDALSRL